MAGGQSRFYCVPGKGAPVARRGAWRPQVSCDANDAFFPVSFS